MEKVQINLRIEKTLNSYIRAVSDEHESNFTSTVETMLRVALENRKDIKKDLDKKRILALEAIKFEDADAALHIELKKAYTVENFRKLAYKLIKSRDMTAERRKAVLDSMFKRVEDIFGKDSPEYKECRRISNIKE